MIIFFADFALAAMASQYQSGSNVYTYSGCALIVIAGFTLLILKRNREQAKETPQLEEELAAISTVEEEAAARDKSSTAEKIWQNHYEGFLIVGTVLIPAIVVYLIQIF